MWQMHSAEIKYSGNGKQEKSLFTGMGKDNFFEKLHEIERAFSWRKWAF